MEEKKIELECEYCGVPITEKDHKCPNCGANCTEKIKKYKQQQEKLEKEEQERRIEQSKAIQKQMNAPVAGILIFAVVVMVFIIVIGVGVGSGALKNNNEEKAKKGVECKYDSYELYNYVSDNFPEQYNTPDGYQKIAFHIVCENKGNNEEMITGFDVKLTADDYAVKMADLKVGVFERVDQGKAEYPSILNNEIGAGEKLQGYVGFVVPKDKKELKLTFKGTTTTIDNPVFEG